ncbi:HNH endonuclease [Schleiferilactobacillus shenzhenensis]|uniref:HNH endonuclease n=1 Tax=Schleiferilactobacillus shenzhenensis TaxID=1231337 RepID=UPI0004022CA2|nr:HNH endonuclease signature motif containing protein [Schleiferilactobacillus shenzhenensis]
MTDSQAASICAMCRAHGVAAGDFANPASQLFSQGTGLTYTGAEQTTGQPLTLTKTARRQAEGIADSFAVAPPAVAAAISPADFSDQLWQMLHTPPDEWPSGDLPTVLAAWGYPVQKLFNQNTLDLTTRQYIREHYHHICQYCGRYGNSVDHMDPVSVSADNTIANLTLACSECNQLKGDMPYADFIRIDAATAPLKADLRRLEQAANAFQGRVTALQSQLAALTHQAADPLAPGAAALRRRIKVAQDLLDQSKADSKHISDLRSAYVHSRWAVAQYQEETDQW